MTYLAKDTLSVLMPGFTHYVDLGGGKEAAIHYGTDSASFMRLPTGERMTGTWKLLDDGYHVAWENGPEMTWHLDHQPGSIAYVDGGEERRGTVTRIVPGDAESLAA